jgi:hypothetical protein
MNKYRKHIDQFFREKLGNYRETPPPDVWDDLEQRLDGLAAAPKPAAPGGRWMWHVAIVSVILFMGASAVKKYYNSAVTANTDKAVAVNQSANTGIPVTGNNANSTTSEPTTAASSQPATENAVNDNNTDNSSNNYNNQNSNTAIAQNLHTGSTNNNNHQNHSKTTVNGAKKGTAAATHNRTSGKTNKNTNNAYVKNTYSSSTTPSTYNNTLSNPATEEAANENRPNASPNTTLSVVSKPEDPKNPTKKDITENKKTGTQNHNLKKTKPSFARIEAGIKTGFESGFTTDAAYKFVVSPYVQFNLSPKFAIMAQPAVKATMMQSHNLGTPTSYYKINSETSELTTNSSVPNTVSVGSTTDTVSWTSKYRFSQAHDSIVKSNKTAARTIMQYELPILMKYNLTKHFAVYGGVNVVYSQMVTIAENTITVKNISRTLDTTITTTNAPAPGGPSGLGFNYTGTPYSQYSGPMKPAQTGYQFAVGYMVGFTLTAHDKWLFDALVQQAPARQDVKAGYNINTPLSATYLRLSIGYKITK